MEILTSVIIVSLESFLEKKLNASILTLALCHFSLSVFCFCLVNNGYNTILNLFSVLKSVQL